MILLLLGMSFIVFASLYIAQGDPAQMVALDAVNFGRGQIIVKLPNGTLVGGTESRTDSNIACY